MTPEILARQSFDLSRVERGIQQNEVQQASIRQELAELQNQVNRMKEDLDSALMRIRESKQIIDTTIARAKEQKVEDNLVIDKKDEQTPTAQRPPEVRRTVYIRVVMLVAMTFASFGIYRCWMRGTPFFPKL